MCHKRPTKDTYIREKRLKKETYKRMCQKNVSKDCVKRMCQQHLSKETQFGRLSVDIKRDLQKRPTNMKRDLHI